MEIEIFNFFARQGSPLKHAIHKGAVANMRWDEDQGGVAAKWSTR